MLPEEIEVKIDEKKSIKINADGIEGNTTIIEKKVVVDGNGITRVRIETEI